MVSTHHIKTLVVDDEELIRWSLHNALRDIGFIVELASSGDEALQMLNSTHFDIVITDYKMPGLSGLDLLEKIKEKKAETKVIMISAYFSLNTIKKAQEFGAFRCVDKPFGIDDFLRIVKEATEENNN
jgi:DNA-binding NtrC family response regulator